MSDAGGHGVDRRAALRAIGLGVVGLAMPALGLRDGLRARDRRLAALGARLTAERPALARRLAAEVARRVADVPPRPTAARLARRARAACRRSARIDLARGDVVLVDGWTLARSEAALAAYLARLV